MSHNTVYNAEYSFFKSNLLLQSYEIVCSLRWTRHARMWHIRNALLTYSVALVRKQTIPTERPSLVGEVSANLCG
jgi:hypothetical protein